MTAHENRWSLRQPRQTPYVDKVLSEPVTRLRGERTPLRRPQQAKRGNAAPPAGCFRPHASDVTPDCYYADVYPPPPLQTDTVYCGLGVDVVRGTQREDEIAANCEKVSYARQEGAAPRRRAASIAHRGAHKDRGAFPGPLRLTSSRRLLRHQLGPHLLGLLGGLIGANRVLVYQYLASLLVGAASEVLLLLGEARTVSTRCWAGSLSSSACT